jgi:colicin import membrane protein
VDVAVTVHRRVEAKRAARLAARAEASSEEVVVLRGSLQDPLGGAQDPSGDPRHDTLTGRPSDAPEGSDAPDDPADPRFGMRGTGHALPVALRVAFEQIFDQDFGDVRLFDDRQAALAADAIGAEAFTDGERIVLGASARAGSRQERALAHELVHVVQAREGRLNLSGEIGPDHPIEQEAYRSEDRLLALLHADAETRARVGLRGGETVSPRGDVAGAVLPAVEGAFAAVMDLLSGDDALAGELRGLLGDLGGLLGDVLRPALEAGPGEDLLDAGWGGVVEALSSLGVPDTAPSALDDVLGGLDLANHAGGDDVAEQAGPLLARLARGLGLSPDTVELLTGPEAAQRTRAHGTGGMMEGGRVLLDPEGFDPTTREGVRLLAHELVHVAQQRLGGGASNLDGVDDPFQLAEVEAMVLSERAAAGGALSAPIVGLPSSAVAFDNPVSGTDLKGQLSTYHSIVHGSKDSLKDPGAPSSNSADPTAKEDSGKKLSRYEDGVDGIGDMIGDLDAFDDLCEALDDGEPYQSALNRVRASEPYRQLTEMWQGALDGGSVSAQMIKAFNDEFTDRGFWASTEKAFALVREACKRDAKRQKDAEAALKKKQEAEAAAANIADAETVTNSDSKGKKNANGEAGPKVDPALEQYLAATVEPVAPKIPSFEDLRKVTDEQLAGIAFERNHQIGLANEVATNKLPADRTTAVLDTLTSSFTGNFVKGFTDQAIDTLILDTIGSQADKLLTTASKGMIRTPMIGPMIGLLQNKPWSGEFWTTQGKDLSKGWNKLTDIDDTLAKLGQAKDAGDVVGIFCDALADLFGGLANILSVAQSIIGTLSAVCYVVGGIFIIVGIALAWLGVGAGLISAGGWLVRAGGILARINTVLGSIVLILSLLETVFRTAAAFLVPSEMLADNLAGVGDAAGNFGDKAGAKLGDKTAGAIKDKVGSMGSKKSGTATDKEPDGQQQGADTAKKVHKQLDDTNNGLDKVVKEAQKQQGDGADPAKAAPDKQAPPKNQGDDASADANNKPKGGDGADSQKKTSTATKVAKAAWNTVKAPFAYTMGKIRETGAAFRELGQLVTNPKRSAAEGLAPYTKLNDQIDEAKKAVAELQKKFDDLPHDSPELQKAYQELNTAKKGLEKLEGQKWATDQVEKTGQKGRDDAKKSQIDSSPEGQKKLQDDIEAKKKEDAELQSKKKQLDEDLPDTKKKLTEAEEKQKAAEAELEQQKKQLAEAEKHLEGIEKAKQKAQEAKDLRTKKQGLTEEAQKLREQADKAAKAEQLKGEVEAHQEKVATAKATAKEIQAKLNAKEGVRIKVDVGGGQFQRRTIKRFEADGVVVHDGRNEVKIPYDKVKNQGIAEQGKKLGETRAVVKDEQQQIATKKAEAEGLNPDGKDPVALREEAGKKQEEAKALDSQIEGAEGQSKYTGTDKSEADLKASSGDLGEKVTAGTKGADKGKAEVARLKAKLDELNKEKTTTDKRSEEVKAEIDQAKKDLRAAEGMASHEGYMAGSSGNATGGVGSAYKDLGAFSSGIHSLIVGLGGLMAMAVPGKKDDEAVKAFADEMASQKESKDRTIGTVLDSRIDKALGAKESDELKVIGKKVGQLEQLMELAIPTAFEDLYAQRDRAQKAYEVYLDEHQKAYAAYTAEQAVGTMAAETKKLSEGGKPIVKAAEKEWKAVKKGKEDELQRTQVLQGSKKDVKKPEDGMASLVMDLIGKIGDKGDDALDGGAKPGDKSAGKNVSEQQNKAGDETKAQNKASTDASKQQREFLDQALVLGSKQQVFVNDNISKLKDKAAAEEQIKTEIQIQKAGHLQKREAARTEADDASAKFVSAYTELETWAKTYREKRQAFG